MLKMGPNQTKIAESKCELKQSNLADALFDGEELQIAAGGNVLYQSVAKPLTVSELSPLLENKSSAEVAKTPTTSKTCTLKRKANDGENSAAANDGATVLTTLKENREPPKKKWLRMSNYSN